MWCVILGFTDKTDRRSYKQTGSINLRAQVNFTARLIGALQIAYKGSAN